MLTPDTVVSAHAELVLALQRAINAAGSLQADTESGALPLSLADAGQLGAQFAAVVRTVAGGLVRTGADADPSHAAKSADALLSVVAQLVLRLSGGLAGTTGAKAALALRGTRLGELGFVRIAAAVKLYA
jgi:hypothetical protein